MKAHFTLNTRSEVCSSTQFMFPHRLKLTIILNLEKSCINHIEFKHFATDFAKNNNSDTPCLKMLIYPKV